MARSCSTPVGDGSAPASRRSSPRSPGPRHELDRTQRWVARGSCAARSLLAWAGTWWHLAEFAIALGAGLAAGSVALVAFGIDSLIELAAGGVIIWLLAARRIDSQTAERRAQQLIAATYALLASYVAVEATRTLIDGTPSGREHRRDRARSDHGTDDAAAGDRQATGRQRPRLACDCERGNAEHDLRLPLARAARRARRERAPRLVVGRPRGRACHRRRRGPRGRAVLARRLLLVLRAARARGAARRPPAHVPTGAASPLQSSVSRGRDGAG